ncbi:MAG: DUF1800 domain-containing protein [Chlorobi bacterium]|nr:MAG: hypothetical protein UZ07_CHB004001054 [Chlorobi bacterium OLB7]MBK8910494.1 DUF1800 domain-containing protein [Chlorobiota bacterium]MBX7216939.1 DUF1800 domain-containing protein [Candidatus Kapabacteria bacterium]
MDRRNFLTFGTPRRATPQQGTQTNQRNGGAQNPPAFLRRTTAGLEPYSGPFTYKEAAHLLRRCVVGPTETEIRQAVTDGFEATMQKLFTPFTPAPTFIQDWVGQDPQIRPADASQAQAFQDTVFQHREMLLKWWMNTIATSPTSIQERMVIFWHNHFTSEMQAVNIAEFMHTQNQLFRSMMFGNFKQFVKDVTKDVAMLIYLDGIKNYKQGQRSNINENYARELQELYTMGVTDWDGNPNYTQEDVSEAARALSGWGFSPSTKGTLYAGLNSLFLTQRWDSGNKTFLGKTGAWKADDIVDIIFEQRADQVAKFMCEKFYRWFVYDIPDRTIITAMAETFRSNNWEIKPVIEQLLRSAHFFDDTNIGALEKSPVDYMIGAIRQLSLKDVPDFNGQTGRATQDLRNRMNTQGMVLFDPPNVKGWPGGRTWVSTSTLPIRQKFSIDVADGVLKNRQTPIYGFDPIPFAKQFSDPNDLTALSNEMARFLLNTEPSDQERQMLFDTILDGGKDYEWKIDDPTQKPDVRIRKFIKAAVQLAKYQLY